jgi:hypothetical protein
MAHRRKVKRKAKQASKGKRRGMRMKKRELKTERKLKRGERKMKRQDTRGARRQTRLDAKTRRQEMRQAEREERISGLHEEEAPQEQEVRTVEEIGQEIEQEQPEQDEDFTDTEKEEGVEMEEEGEQYEDEGEGFANEGYEYHEEQKKRRLIGKVGNVAGWAVLYPFLLPMKAILKAKGYTGAEGGKGDIQSIATMFHKHIILGEAYEGVSHYEHFTGAVAAGIISGIISYIRNLKQAQKEGAKLGEGEEKLVQVGDKINKEYEEQKSKATASEIGEIFTKYWWVLAIIVIILFANKKS